MRVRLHKYDLRPREPSRKRSILDSELPIDLAEGKALFSVKEKRNLKRRSRAILNVTFSSCTICLADYNKYRWGWFSERKFGQNGRFWSFLSVLFWFPSMERSASRGGSCKNKFPNVELFHSIKLSSFGRQFPPELICSGRLPLVANVGYACNHFGSIHTSHHFQIWQKTQKSAKILIFDNPDLETASVFQVITY